MFPEVAVLLLGGSVLRSVLLYCRFEVALMFPEVAVLLLRLRDADVNADDTLCYCSMPLATLAEVGFGLRERGGGGVVVRQERRRVRVRVRGVEGGEEGRRAMLLQPTLRCCRSRWVGISSGEFCCTFFTWLFSRLHLNLFLVYKQTIITRMLFNARCL